MQSTLREEESHLSDKETRALYKWCDVDPAKAVDANGEPCIFALAGMQHNVIRACEAYGPKMVAILAARGFLEVEASPVEALEILIEKLLSME